MSDLELKIDTYHRVATLCTFFVLALGAVSLPAAAFADEQEDADGYSMVQTTTRDTQTRNPQGEKVSKNAGHMKGIEARKDELTHLAPMAAVRGITDSPQIKKVLRSMITSQVPVMYQTMMMVENGAATGFMGSMETVPGFLDNVTNAAQLELKLKEITDSTGAEALGFANAIHDGMKKQGEAQGNKLWPVGIFYASGDKLDDQPLADKSGFKLEEKPDSHPLGGSTRFDAINLDKASEKKDITAPVKSLSAGNSGNGPVEVKSAGSSGRDVKLSEVLWNSAKESRSQKFGTDLEFQTKIIGDILMKKGDASPDNPTSVSEAEFVEPTESVKDANASTNSSAGTNDELRGFYYLRHEKKRELWKNTYKLLGEYCKFKSDNDNRGRTLFEKYTPAKRITPEMLKETSSQSFKWTISLIDIFFKTWIESRSQDQNSPTKILCDFEGNEEAEKSMPIDFKPPDKNFDNCQSNPKHCSRNKQLLKLVELIAEDRVIDDLKNWYEEAMNRSLRQHPWIALKVQELMCTSLRANRSAGKVSLCDTTNWLESIAEQNRQSWVRIIDELSRMAQNSIGSASFRPQENSIQNGPSGSMGSGS